MGLVARQASSDLVVSATRPGPWLGEPRPGEPRPGGPRPGDGGFGNGDLATAA